MRVFLMLAALIGLAAGCVSQAGGPISPSLKRSIPLPGVSGRIDHLAYDPQTKRLFVAALENGSLEVIDLEKRERTKSVTGLKEPQGIVFVLGTKQVVVACGGDGTVRAFDTTTLEEKVKVDVGEDADNVRLDESGRVIAVGHGNGGVALLDAATLKETGEVKVDGHPESFQLEPASQRMFINVPGGLVGGGGSVIVADRNAQNVTATWTLKEAGRNFPMALDAAHNRLYVGCRRSAKLLVVDTDSGKVVASPDCVGDADDVFLDTKTGRVVVIGGDDGGRVDLFETTDHQAYSKVGSATTRAGARTGLLVSETHVIYVAVPKRPGHDGEIREYALPD